MEILRRRLDGSFRKVKFFSLPQVLCIFPRVISPLSKYRIKNGDKFRRIFLLRIMTPIIIFQGCFFFHPTNLVALVSVEGGKKVFEVGRKPSRQPPRPTRGGGKINDSILTSLLSSTGGRDGGHHTLRL